LKAQLFDTVGPQEMLATELEILGDLIRSSRARDVLEVGMATGSSSLAILSALQKSGGGHLTSIDPFQLAPLQAVEGMMRGFGSAGVNAVRTAGFEDMHTLMPVADYVAMPQLLDAGRRFDFIVIDGYHSFDYTMLDFFYSDLLLKSGGHLAFHDSTFPAVFRVCQFVQANKPYRRVGPPPALLHSSLVKKALRRLYYAVSGGSAAFTERRTRWKSLAVFVKERDALSDQFTLRGI
jgi:predicted O-methyltransferase YrrM